MRKRIKMGRGRSVKGFAFHFSTGNSPVVTAFLLPGTRGDFTEALVRRLRLEFGDNLIVSRLSGVILVCYPSRLSALFNGGTCCLRTRTSNIPS